MNFPVVIKKEMFLFITRISINLFSSRFFYKDIGVHGKKHPNTSELFYIMLTLYIYIYIQKKQSNCLLDFHRKNVLKAFEAYNF